MVALACMFLFASKPTTTLEKGVSLVEHSRFEQAIPVLKSLLYPPQIGGADAIRARVALARAYFYERQIDACKAELATLFEVAPSTNIDPFLSPPDWLQFFEGQKKAAPPPAIVVAPAPRVVASAPIAVAAPVSLPPWYVRGLPLGIGHFAASDLGVGILFLSLEVALIAANVGLAFVNQGRVNAAGWVNDPMSLPLYVAQFATAGAFYLTLGLDMIDGIAFLPRRRGH
jgi:hypothetical protein